MRDDALLDVEEGLDRTEFDLPVLYSEEVYVDGESLVLLVSLDR